MSLGSGSLVWGCQLHDYWFLRGSGLPSLLPPLSCLNLLLGGLAEILWTIFHKMARTSHIQSNFGCFSGTAQLHWQNRWYSQLKVAGSSSSKDLASSASSAFMPNSSATPLLSTVADWAVKVWPHFKFQEGNKFPDVLEWVMFDPLVGVVFMSRGSLAYAHLSNFWAARSRSEYPVGCSPSTLWANICQYFRFRPS